jgi:hypothetical protein
MAMNRMTALALVAVMTALGFAGAIGAPAQAMAPERTRVDDSFTFTNHFCSFPIRVATRITGTDTLFFDADGNVLRDELHLFVYAVWRNAGSGKTVIEADHVHNVIYADESFAIMGLNFHLSLPHGRTVLIDAGKLVVGPDGDLTFEAGNHQVTDGAVTALCSALA